jgi:glycosyltransferase involved in cell wall biosynthesis
MNQQSKKKLTYVINDGDFFISHRFHIAQRAIQLGYEVSLIAPLFIRSKEIEAAGITFYEWNLNRHVTSFIEEWKSIVRLIQLYRMIQPDIVHHITIKAVLYGSIASRFQKIKKVINALPGLGQMFTDPSMRGQIKKLSMILLYRIIFFRFEQKIIFQNQKDLDEMKNLSIVSSNQSVLIRGAGISLEKFPLSPEPEGKITILMASRPLREKGIFEFVQAAEILNQKFPNLQFIFAGEIGLANIGSIPVDQFEKWKNESCVQFLGMVHDMPELIRRSHIICLPTYYGEGLPKFLLEAAAVGRPIVATNNRGCAEIVTEGRNGFLVPEKNVPKLVQALLNLIESKMLRIEFGKQGRNIISELQLTEADVAQKTIELY